MDEPRGERVAGADSIDDGDFVMPAEGVTLSIDEQAAPTVFARIFALAQGDGHLLDARKARKGLCRDVEITLVLERAARDLGLAGPDPEHGLAIFFVRDE